MILDKPRPSDRIPSYGKLLAQTTKANLVLDSESGNIYLYRLGRGVMIFTIEEWKVIAAVSEKWNNLPNEDKYSHKSIDKVS